MRPGRTRRRPGRQPEGEADGGGGARRRGGDVARKRTRRLARMRGRDVARTLALSLGFLGGAALGMGPLATPAAAQDAHLLAPVDTIEARLLNEPPRIIDTRGSRFEGDRTSRAVLQFPGGELMAVKWAPAPAGGEAFNNTPRYEVAAYQIQKLFLDEPAYVVPPTVLRSFPLEWYRELAPGVRPTFRGTESVLVTLQYWLFNVTDEGVWDEARLARDTVYARHLGNLNILTRLIRHGDSNEGNFLISSDPDRPRVFAVDNGVAFLSESSSRGTEWRRVRVDRLPASTVSRLRTLTEADLVRQLETLAEFRILPDGHLERVAPTENLDPNGGIRRSDDTIQMGLTRFEIRGVWRRLGNLLDDVDHGRIGTF